MDTFSNYSHAPKSVDRQKVDAFLLTNFKYLPADAIGSLRETLYHTDEAKFALISSIKLKNPTHLLLISIFLGLLGIDRFLLKSPGMGVLKLLTRGCCFVI